MENIYCVCIVLVFTITCCECRKYDIEQEAHKLYDESFSAVVHRFRRTPEYLTILQDELIKMKYAFEIIEQKLEASCIEQLNEAVVKELKLNVSKSLREAATDNNNMKQKKQIQHETPVSDLDNYAILHSLLSVAERNRMKDIGYEYSGKMIHDLMKHFLPDDSGRTSTKQPGGGNKQEKTTTEHIHEIISTTTTEGREQDTIASSTLNHHHHHQSTVAPESQRNFKPPNI